MIPNLATGGGRGRGGHGIDRALLAVGVAGVGAANAFAPRASVLQPCSAGRKHDFKDAERLVRRMMADDLILSFMPKGNSRTAMIDANLALRFAV